MKNLIMMLLVMLLVTPLMLLLSGQAAAQISAQNAKYQAGIHYLEIANPLK